MGGHARRRVVAAMAGPTTGSADPPGLARQSGSARRRLRLRQAQALSDVSAAATLPQVNAQGQSTRQLHAEDNLVSPIGNGNYDWQTRATVSVSYDLDLWGREREALTASLNDAQVAAADARISALNLETAIVRGYLQLAEQYQQKTWPRPRCNSNRRCWSSAGAARPPGWRRNRKWCSSKADYRPAAPKSNR